MVRGPAPPTGSPAVVLCGRECGERQITAFSLGPSGQWVSWGAWGQAESCLSRLKSPHHSHPLASLRHPVVKILRKRTPATFLGTPSGPTPSQPEPTSLPDAWGGGSYTEKPLRTAASPAGPSAQDTHCPFSARGWPSLQRAPSKWKSQRLVLGWRWHEAA